MDKKHHTTDTDVEKYPGISDDIADDETVDPRLVEQAIKLDNDNPPTDGE